MGRERNLHFRQGRYLNVYIHSFIFSFLHQRQIFIFSYFLYFALFSKEAGIAYPLALILYIYLFKKFDKKIIYSLLGFFVITIMYVALRLSTIVNAGPAPRDEPLYRVALFFIKAVAKYLGLIFFPINQHMSYTTKLPASFLQADVLLSFIVFVSLIWLFFYFLKKTKFISFFIGWFFIMLIPYSGLYPINAFFAEHFIYTASLGVFAVLAYFLQKIKSKAVFNLVFFSYFSLFSFATIKYNFIWQDPVKFYKRIIAFSPDSYIAYNNLASIYFNQGELEEFQKLVNKSLEINPQSLGMLNLARFYTQKKEYSEAISLIKGALAKEPNNSLAWGLLGDLYSKKGELNLAEDYYKKATALNLNYIPLWLDFYMFYKSLGREEEAETIKEKIKRLDKFSLADLYFKEAGVWFEQKELDKSAALINESLRINPYNSGYYNLRGCILRKKGDYTQAIGDFKKALRISPSNSELYNNLGNLFAITGDFNNARANFQKAISLNKGLVNAYFNLGLLYFKHNKFSEAKNLFEKTLSLDSSHALAKEYLTKLSSAYKLSR